MLSLRLPVLKYDAEIPPPRLLLSPETIILAVATIIKHYYHFPLTKNSRILKATEGGGEISLFYRMQ